MKKRGLQQEKGNGYHGAETDGAEHRGARCFSAAHIISGGIILTDKGHDGLCEAVDNKIADVFKIQSSRVPGDAGGAKMVDGGLYHHVGDGEDHSLKSRRAANP